jgi:hypothetical protein
MTGAVLGTLRIRIAQRRLASPYQGWHAWHHWLGLACATFVLTWIFSGWLSVDSGRLFSIGRLTDAEAMAVTGSPAWAALSPNELQLLSVRAKETEWFAFGGRIYRRDRIAPDVQHLILAGDQPAAASRAVLTAEEVGAVANALASGCKAAVAIGPGDPYGLAVPSAPVYRSVCGEIWFHIDAASGTVLEKLDPSRRAYRWLYGALHTFDVPALIAAPAWRTALIVTLSAGGLGLSLTGVVIGWRRLRLTLNPKKRAT